MKTLKQLSTPYLLAIIYVQALLLYVNFNLFNL
jgi:hypothetical protein